jgi:hypothetical protein
MKELLLSRNKIKNFLSERLTYDILQMDEKKVFSLIRYEGIGGLEKTSDNDLFVRLVEIIPEFKLLQMVSVDQNNIAISLKEEYEENEEAILIDITRIIQMKLS